MLTRRYRAGGGTLPYFGSHRIRHGTATLHANYGMPLEELSRYVGYASTEVTRRHARRPPTLSGAGPRMPSNGPGSWRSADTGPARACTAAPGPGSQAWPARFLA